MTLIVKTITRLTVGLILIYGIYIVSQGHLGPGGGFAGGVIVALSFVHLVLAFGKDAVAKKLNQTSALTCASFGALAFLSIVALGFLKRQSPFVLKDGFKLLSAWPVSLAEVAIAVMTGAGLFLIFLALVFISGGIKEK